MCQSLPGTKLYLEAESWSRTSSVDRLIQEYRSRPKMLSVNRFRFVKTVYRIELLFKSDNELSHKEKDKEIDRLRGELMSE